MNYVNEIWVRSISKFIIFLTAIVFVTISQSVPAQVILREAEVNGQRQLHVASDADQRVDPAAVRAYDNWRYPGGGGNTSTRGQIRTGVQEVGDDLQLMSGAAGIVNDLGWSVAHTGSTGALSALRVIKRFYAADSLALLFTDDAFYNFVGVTIRPGESAIIFSNGGLYRGLNIPALERMYFTLQFSDPVGMEVADLGIGYGGPINTGSSSSLIRNFTTGQNIDLGTDPQNNLLFFIDSVAVPAPSAAAVLGCGSLLALRRLRPRKY